MRRIPPRGIDRQPCDLDCAIEATDVPRIRAAVNEVLAKSSYALAAQVIAEEIASTGSARDCLEELFTS